MVRPTRSRPSIGTGGSRVVEVSLHEGRKHVVRRMLLGEVGHPVTRLVRTKIGALTSANSSPASSASSASQEVGASGQKIGL